MPYKSQHKKEQSSRISIPCFECGTPFMGRTIDKYCSNACRAIVAKKAQTHFKERNPESQKKYNQNRVSKNPSVWKDKTRTDRQDIITALGGECIVCKANNPNWLHIDYIPTMRGTGFRHPRHKKWVMANIRDFFAPTIITN